MRESSDPSSERPTTLGERRPPRRFRRRLTAAFVLVAAVSAGFIAVTSFVVVREYRLRTVRAQSRAEAHLAVALAPTPIDAAGFERLRALFEPRSDARLLVLAGDARFSSSPDLTFADLPDQLDELEVGDPELVETTVSGQRVLVVGEMSPDGTRFYAFFSLDQIEEGLAELARVLVATWGVTLLMATLVGRRVAARTLRPVGDAAVVAETIADGDLGARLPPGDDEFGALAASFNHMAGEVQRLVQRLEQANARERRFTADVAHELRTPLTGLTTSAALLADHLDDLPAGARRPAELLIADTSRLRDLVLELLELSRLESNAVPPRVEPLRVDAALAAVVAGAQLRRNADIRVATGDTAVIADPARLRRILANVLDNAVVHGRPPVDVSARRVDGQVVIDIVDHGSGIAGEDLDMVFDRFAKSDRSRSTGGTGLGLAIARQHARSLHGDLVAANGPTGGARFTLRLPAAPDGLEVGPR